MVQAVIQNQTSIEELMTRVENDTWSYSSPQDGPVGYSSPSFVVGLYRAAGLFDEDI